MTVDATWDGVPLFKSAVARAEGGDWFIELEQPMPVGTLLTLTGDVQATVQVARVHEGVGAGMLVKKADGRPTAVEPEKSEENGGKGKRKRKKTLA